MGTLAIRKEAVVSAAEFIAARIGGNQVHVLVDFVVNGTTARERSGALEHRESEDSVRKSRLSVATSAGRLVRASPGQSALITRSGVKSLCDSKFSKQDLEELFQLRLRGEGIALQNSLGLVENGLGIHRNGQPAAENEEALNEAELVE